jgi:hypothetical protein
MLREAAGHMQHWDADLIEVWVYLFLTKTVGDIALASVLSCISSKRQVT